MGNYEKGGDIVQSNHKKRGKAGYNFIALVGGLWLNPLLAAEPTPVIWIDFESKSNFSVPSNNFLTTLLQHRKLTLSETMGVGNSTALKAEYVGDSRGSERIVVDLRLPKNLMEATLCFDVMFEKNFQFVKGGKLHGLGPVNKITGGNPIKPDGWSARAMWGNGGSLITYTYHQKMKKSHGENGTGVNGYKMKKGEYQSICQYVKVNKPASASNGVFRLYANGKLVQKRENAQFRKLDNADAEINKVLFSTFLGGNSPDWAPRNSNGTYATQYSYFDNIAVYEVEHVRVGPSTQYFPHASIRFEELRQNARPDRPLRILSLDGRILDTYSPKSEDSGHRSKSLIFLW